MALIVLIPVPVLGHLRPMCALGAELVRRGHRVVMIHQVDVRAEAHNHGLEFIPVGLDSHGPGYLPRSVVELSRYSGMALLRRTLKEIHSLTLMLAQALPRVVDRLAPDMIIGDQTEAAAGLIAEMMNVPLVSVACALPLDREPDLPAPFTGRQPGSGWLRRWRNRLGYALQDHMLHPVHQLVDDLRRKQRLSPLKAASDAWSQSLCLFQLIQSLDFPRRHLPESVRYVGPLRHPEPEWTNPLRHRVTPERAVWISFGSMQGARLDRFAVIAQVVRSRGLLPFIAHGGMLDLDAVAHLESLGATVVAFAPQRQALSHCRLAVTHAGLNTVLDAAACGVPMLCLPIGFEQFGIAARVEHSGAGLVCQHPSKRALETGLDRLLADPSFHVAGMRLRADVLRSGGVQRAGNIIEDHLPALIKPDDESRLRDSDGINAPEELVHAVC